MEEILHITTRAEWDRAVAGGAYRADSLATEGFLHASTPRQVAASANRFYRGRTGLVVLRIDPARVVAEIRPEASPHSPEPFPHIYGPLNIDAVVGVVAIEPDEAGEFGWPPR